MRYINLHLTFDTYTVHSLLHTLGVVNLKLIGYRM